MLETLHKRRNAGLRFGVVRINSHEHADAPHLLGLLRRAAKGQAVAPPSKVMNLRRLIRAQILRRMVTVQMGPLEGVRECLLWVKSGHRGGVRP